MTSAVKTFSAVRAIGQRGNMLQLWVIANTILWTFSVQLGALTLSLNILILAAAGAVWLLFKSRVSLRSAKIIAGLVVYLCASSAIALAGPCRENVTKAILSMPILIFLVFIGLEVGHRATPRDWLGLQKIALGVLAAVFCALFTEMLFPSLFPSKVDYRVEGKFSGLFREPSHVAFSVFPCVAILLVSNDKQYRRCGTVALIGLLVLSRSSTIIALAVLWLVYRSIVKKNFRRAAVSFAGLALIVGLAAAVDFNRFILPTLQRVTGVAGSDTTENISSLVYVQGWEDALFNFRRTQGVGLGINMMGCGTLPPVPARLALELILPIQLNAEDGSFLLSKLISEAGVIGLALYFLAIWRWLRFERFIALTTDPAVKGAAAIQAALMFSFVTLSILRGAGYFSGTLLLWVCTAGVSLRQFGLGRTHVHSDENRKPQKLVPVSPLSS